MILSHGCILGHWGEARKCAWVSVCRDSRSGGVRWSQASVFSQLIWVHCKPLVSFHLHSLSKAWLCLVFFWLVAQTPEAKRVLLQLWGQSRLGLLVSLIRRMFKPRGSFLGGQSRVLGIRTCWRTSPGLDRKDVGSGVLRGRSWAGGQNG